MQVVSVSNFNLHSDSPQAPWDPSLWVKSSLSHSCMSPPRLQVMALPSEQDGLASDLVHRTGESPLCLAP